jgi:hypothetical protein
MIKNIIALLVVATLALAGYYLYTQESVSFTVDEQSLVSLEAEAAKFIERQNLITQISLDLAVLQQPQLRGLQSFTTPIISQPKGRPNPFLSPDASVVVPTPASAAAQ